jgi:hypothetical protein
MKIRTKELQQALDYLKKHGDTQELDFYVDRDLKSRVIIKADILGDEGVITLFSEELNIFPKITRTERLS